ncbi:hypothetical protein skT53_24880 [Effusibacillus dendaii]|uniref:Uncharacterized protein n=1 Tax=Effusibacillus dendaii TaxID=2743772 RepID=A0A7I8DBE2_9BACL|nr:hypothetical protein skT53_24880 [Effusibacillus dendaii]
MRVMFTHNYRRVINLTKDQRDSTFLRLYYQFFKYAFGLPYGKRTIAKEKLYKHINKRIREIYPNFNIGISAGTKNIHDRWLHPYRHWLFVPSQHKIAPEYTKKKMN